MFSPLAQVSGLFFVPPGRPKAKTALSGGSDPRSGGAWGLFFACTVAFDSLLTYRV